MNAANSVDRTTFLQNLKLSNLLTTQQVRQVVDDYARVEDPRDIAKGMIISKLVTKYQAGMLLNGRNAGFFLGPYRILDLLGSGGMGKVFKAVHQTMNRVVALKVLAPQMLKTERAQQLFQHEVQAAAQLSHPNIVMAYDANEVSGRHYLAMEYVDGSNLEKYVRRHGSLPVGMACEVIFQTANGLEHAFERGMVHRDIKPANLLIQHEPDSENVQVKILDFGLARLHQTDKSLGRTHQTILTRSNTVMGTPDFLSPEQGKNLHKADIRSDLYSLGCTFYYLLTGQVPFPGGTVREKLARHAIEEPAPLESVRPDVPKAVADIVRKLMAKKPADRFQTPDALMEALSPHAAPSVMDWPVTPQASSGEGPLVQPAQDDTEPKAVATTQISDAESILEWVDANRRQNRKLRRLVVGAALVGLGALAAAGAALAWWLVI